MLSHVRTGESISYSDLPYTYISREPAARGEKPGAQAKRTMGFDLVGSPKPWHHGARVMCPTGWMGGVAAGQADGDGGPAIVPVRS